MSSPNLEQLGSLNSKNELLIGVPEVEARNGLSVYCVHLWPNSIKMASAAVWKMIKSQQFSLALSNYDKIMQMPYGARRLARDQNCSQN